MARIKAKGFIRFGILCSMVLILGIPGALASLDISNQYSPRNRERARRRRTDYIILHTTEGPEKGSLQKLKKNGEAHYLVGLDGHVYRIIDKNRVAYHCGRSMWKARKDLDRYAVGIEVVGYHNKEITSAQYRALAELILQLQKVYGIPDSRVLTHCMVAYGTPNRWHKRPHRGRKRCGMRFALPSVRKRLGLDHKPSYDPDVRAGRLAVGDAQLAALLYGPEKKQKVAAQWFASDDAQTIARGRSAWDIAREAYNKHSTRYIFPDGTEKRGDQIRNWKKMPVGTRVVLAGIPAENEPERVKELGVHGQTAQDVAGSEFNSKTTIYFYPDGRMRQGDELTSRDFKRMPKGTRVLVGYVFGGYITGGRSAFDICGKNWNAASTYYRYDDGTITPGHLINEGAIPRNTMVFFVN